MDITRGQWALALMAAAAVHALLLAAFFLGGFNRQTPADTPEGVMVSLDDLDPGPPPQAQASEAPVNAPTPQAESASAPPASEVSAADTSGPPAPEAPQPAASIGPEAAESAATPATPAPATAAPQSVEEVPAISPTAEPASAVAVAPINAAEAVETQEQVTAQAPEVAQAQTQEVEPANGAFGNSQEATDDYIVRLRAWLSRHKQYPQTARQAETEGTVRLYLVVDESGNVITERITQSSGSPLLDDAALQMVRRAQPLPRMPAAMRRNRLELVVPIVFSLH